MQLANLERNLHQNITGGDNDGVPKGEPNECLAPFGVGKMKYLHEIPLNAGKDVRTRAFHRRCRGDRKRRAGEWRYRRAG